MKSLFKGIKTKGPAGSLPLQASVDDGGIGGAVDKLRHAKRRGGGGRTYYDKV